MIPDSSNTLGGIALPRGVRWLDRNQHKNVGQLVRFSLAGDQHIRAQAISGRNITLDIRRPYAWLYTAKYDALKALADVPGATYTLSWGGDSYTVAFRHHEGAALDFIHVESPAAAIDQGLWEGQILLMQV